MNTFRIGEREVGDGHPALIIAEIGTNHNRRLDQAKTLVRAAAEAGADAVKFQIYEADDIVNRRIMPSEYGLEKLYPGKTMREVFDQDLRTPREWFPELSDFTRGQGAMPMATAHSGSAAAFICRQGMVAVKIASMDLNNLPVLRDIAEASTVPVIFSTGMSEWADIEESVQVFRRAGKPFGILHCVSNYPADFADLHLQNLCILRDTYGVPVGFSDHTLSTLSAAVAVALGASMIEKHITLSRKDRGPDHPFALEPGEFKAMVDDIRSVESAYVRGAPFAGPSERERRKLPLYRRSLVASRRIAAGAVLAADDIKITRPGTGIAPKHLDEVIGRKASVEIPAETPITWEML